MVQIVPNVTQLNVSLVKTDFTSITGTVTVQTVKKVISSITHKNTVNHVNSPLVSLVQNVMKLNAQNVHKIPLISTIYAPYNAQTEPQPYMIFKITRNSVNLAILLIKDVQYVIKLIDVFNANLDTQTNKDSALN